MNGFLLDTNVPSESIRPFPDENASKWLDDILHREVEFLSVITIGELRRGAILLPPSARRTRIEGFIGFEIPRRFGSRVLPVTQAIADRWGTIDGLRQRAGRPLHLSDGLIAATALEHNLTLVTRNVKDFGLLGLTILNPWEAPS